jgi:4a-hydroxytetrahydrobiopterin dehydratase
MWENKNNTLVREYVFADFKQAFAFMTQVAMLAEQQGHHPKIENVYNRLRLELTTHDSGNTVTEKDKKLAQAIDELK